VKLGESKHTFDFASVSTAGNRQQIKKSESGKQRDRSLLPRAVFRRVSNYWHLPFRKPPNGHIFKLFSHHSSEHKSSESLAPKGF
jgi:hypothetical protein